MLRRRVLGLVLLAAALPAFAQLHQFKPGFNLFSRDQDVQLGREAAAQVERQMPVVRNPDLENYITSIGRRLMASPEAGNFPYTFKVVNDASINAFALPGGPTYVFTGLIKAADNEAQLAGVIAHEMSHVALRHGTNQASKANLIQLPALLASSVLGHGGSILGQLTQLGIGLGANSVLLKFSRDAERQADLNGSHLMAQAGWNPIEMARFFEKLEASGGARGPQFLSDHPNPGNRVKYVEEEIRYLPQRNYATDSPEFQRIKSLVGGMPAPAARSQGQGSAPRRAPRDIRPSGRFRSYGSRSFNIGYPDNWRAFGDNDSAMVTFAPEEAIFQSNGVGAQIGYGAMVSYYFAQDGNADLRRETESLVRQLAQNNPGMEARGQRRLQVNGQDALVSTLYSRSPYQGEREVDSLVTVARPEGLFYVIFIAPESEWNQIQGTFEQMLSSIRFR